MPLMEMLISGVGSLPLSNTFKAQGDGDVVFYLSGSAWSDHVGLLSIKLLLDGKVIGESVGWTNETQSHKTLVPVFIPTTLTYDVHKVELQVGNNQTLTDENDNFQVLVIY